MTTYSFQTPTLGEPQINSPVVLSKILGDFAANYATDDQYIIYDIMAQPHEKTSPQTRENLIELAGPREKIFFLPAGVHAGIITCGGLCPGLNDVIRSIVMTLWDSYQVRKITGFRYGFQGLISKNQHAPMALTPEVVADIHQKGGTILGSSRGGGKDGTIIEYLKDQGINMLFVIGGDGSQRGALKIACEANQENFPLAVVGIPKTIDNDLSFIHKSFGFETAVSLAVHAVSAAYIEAKGAVNGIGLVKLMGRESGFIAANAVLAHNNVDYVLIPEVPFELTGERGLLAQLDRRLSERGHAVVVTAEGAGQNLLEQSDDKDLSGNKKLGDIGLFLKKEIAGYFKKNNREIAIKYIDPGYMIRSAPANPSDSIYCARLGANAVHAAMAGKTQILIGQIHNYLVHIPIALTISHRNVIDPESSFWREVVEATGQPAVMKALGPPKNNFPFSNNDP